MTRPARLTGSLLALALLTACSGGSDGPDRAAAPAAPAPSSSGDALAALPSAAASAPTAPSPGGAAGPSSTPAPAGGGPASAAPPGAAAAPAPGAPSAAPAARSAAPAAAVEATRAGRYTYDSSGSVTVGVTPQRVSGTSTLTVDEPVGDRQSTVLEGDQGRTETDVVLRPDGRYGARLLLTTPAFTKEFRPSPPVLVLPEPATVGRTWRWTATSTDGKTRVTASNRVLRAGSVTVDGKAVATRVVETVLTLRGDLVYDGTTTTDEDPVSHLAVRTRAKGKGTVGGVAFANDTRSTLRSTTPAS